MKTIGLNSLSTPIGRAVAGVLSVFAEFEREMMWERVKAEYLMHENEEDDMDGRNQ